MKLTLNKYKIFKIEDDIKILTEKPIVGQWQSEYHNIYHKNDTNNLFPSKTINFYEWFEGDEEADPNDYEIRNSVK